MPKRCQEEKKALHKNINNIILKIVNISNWYNIKNNKHTINEKTEHFVPKLKYD